MQYLEPIDAAIIADALAAWPNESWDGWHRYSGDMGEKLASKPDSLLPSAVYAVLLQMASRVVQVTNDFIDFGLHGSGMHWILPNGELPRHLDSERHAHQPWIRTNSIVCFMEESDGLLTLDDGRQTVVPSPGKVVMFPTDGNWHWVTRTTNNRRTLALFTYRHTADPQVWNLRTRAKFCDSSPPPP